MQSKTRLHYANKPIMQNELCRFDFLGNLLLPSYCGPDTRMEFLTVHSVSDNTTEWGRGVGSCTGLNWT